ncbi:MAG: ATP-binding protein [Elusimicrobia bacterium]|nr:ATP-binding protein [Elusimicrobiota bacterium]
MIIERELYSKIKPFINSKGAIIVTGMRRVGKTTLLKFISSKINSGNQLFLDLENPINQKYFEEEDFEKILDNLKFLGLNINKKAYIFLDEIQFLKRIPSIVKYLSDHYEIKFFLSGSSGFYLKNLFSESLSGRKHVFELYPLNFREFLKLKKSKISFDFSESKLSKAIFSKLNSYYDEYSRFGGFPQVINANSSAEKEMILDDVFSSYFQMEVRQLSDFRKINVFRDMMLLLMQRTGSKLDIQKISSEIGISRETVYKYLAFLESTYFIKTIRPFTKNADSEIRNMPKLYVCDNGFLSRFAKVDKGVLFENAIFWALNSQGAVNYYQRKSGVEIDFIVDKKKAYEIKFTPRAGDISKLKRLCADLKISDYKIVSKNQSALEHIIYGFLI